jgi:hypothetical protein
MDMKTETEHIFLTFIILILAIGIGYWLNTSREGFDDNTDSDRTTIPQTTTALGSTVSQATNPMALSAAIDNQLSGVSDSTTRDTLQTQLTNLQSLLNRYATLDTPIIMNDEGQVCSMWGDYSNGRFRQQQNQCLELDNTNILKCINATGTTSTCSNIMSDGYINRKSNINYQPMLDSATSTVINAIPSITSQVDNMNQNADTIITSLADRGSIQLQQDELIRNNNENMVYKNKLMEENTEKLAKKQNETNINQNDFSSFMNQITNTDSLGNTYYRIIIGLIIAVVIMGMLNFLFSNILS